MVGVAKEVELRRLATGFLQEEEGITPLLRAVSGDMQKEVPERKAILPRNDESHTSFGSPRSLPRQLRSTSSANSRVFRKLRHVKVGGLVSSARESWVAAARIWRFAQ
jgi:hypothetical protein